VTCPIEAIESKKPDAAVQGGHRALDVPLLAAFVEGARKQDKSAPLRAVYRRLATGGRAAPPIKARNTG
jgi:hypothetical protein